MYPTSSLFLLGLVAQGIEHRFPKPGVASSNLAEAAFFNYIYIYVFCLLTDDMLNSSQKSLSKSLIYVVFIEFFGVFIK